MQPRVSFVLLADSHKQAERSKLDAFGIFSKFLVWATPATRTFSLVVSVDRLPPGTTEFQVLLKTTGGPAKPFAFFTCERHTVDLTAQAAATLSVAFSKLGRHEIGVRPKGARPQQTRWFPFEVELLPWPKLPEGDELASILADPHSMKTAGMKLTCSHCNRVFTFEISVDPTVKRRRGVRLFPPDGRFKCPNCTTLHHLKDIEGQLRAHIGQQTERAKR